MIIRVKNAWHLPNHKCQLLSHNNMRSFGQKVCIHGLMQMLTESLLSCHPRYPYTLASWMYHCVNFGSSEMACEIGFASMKYLAFGNSSADVQPRMLWVKMLVCKKRVLLLSTIAKGIYMCGVPIRSPCTVDL